MVSRQSHRDVWETVGDRNGNDIAVLGGDALETANFARLLINRMAGEIELRSGLNGFGMTHIGVVVEDAVTFFGASFKIRLSGYLLDFQRDLAPD
jgi:hypothetical protein